MYATCVEFYTPTQCVGPKMGGVQDGWSPRWVPQQRRTSRSMFGSCSKAERHGLERWPCTVGVTTKGTSTRSNLQQGTHHTSKHTQKERKRGREGWREGERDTYTH